MRSVLTALVLALPSIASAQFTPHPSQAVSTEQNTFRLTCDEALDRILRLARRLGPGGLEDRRDAGLNGRTAADTASDTLAARTERSATVEVSSGAGWLSSVWTCAEAGELATLTVRSRGRRADLAHAYHALFFRFLGLPR